MNDSDATRYFIALTEILHRNDLDWVVDQANEEIRFGKIVSSEFQISKRNQFLEGRQDILFEKPAEYRTRKREKFNQIIPFTPQESLALLVKAIKRLVVDTNTIQSQVSIWVEAETKETNIKPDIRFFPENSNEESFSLSGFKSQTNQEIINKLELLLTNLENEAGNGH